MEKKINFINGSLYFENKLDSESSKNKKKCFSNHEELGGCFNNF